MKCPNCQVEMEEGLLVGEGGYWRPASSVPGFLRPSNALGAKRSIAWRCPKCGKIELYTEVK